MYNNSFSNGNYNMFTNNVMPNIIAINIKLNMNNANEKF